MTVALLKKDGEGFVPRSYETITVDPLTPTIGGEVSGVDLTQPLSNQQVSELHEALADRLVIFFRDQQISHEDHRRLADHFGGPHIAPSGAPRRLPGVGPEVMRIHADASSTYIAGEDWHSDMSCDEMPPMGSILYLHTVPDYGGDTVFANMYAAYDALSEPMKAHLEGRTAIHDGNLVFRFITPDDMALPIHSHPVIRTHPVTGRKALYVNRGYTTEIEGLPMAESRALLAYLFDHIQHPQFQCRFKWRQHSIAFWDNRCTQHVANWDYFPKERSGFRIQVRGDKPE